MLPPSTCLWQKGFSSHLREISLYAGTWPFQLFTLMAWLEMHLFSKHRFCSKLQGFCPAHYLWEILSSWGIMCFPPLRWDWDCSQQVSPKMVSSVENQRFLLTCHRWHVNVVRASPPQIWSPLAALLEGAVSAAPLPQVSPVLSLLLHPACGRPQEAARGWPGSVLIASGLSGGGLQQPWLQLNCSVFGATSTLGTLQQVQSLSSPTFVFLEDHSCSFPRKDLTWILLCCWYSLFHLLVFPKLQVVK